MVKRAPAKKLSIRTDGTTEIQNWAILGLDLSLSRTGFAALLLEGGVRTWSDVGSYTITEPGIDTWARAQAYAIGIGMELESLWKACTTRGGTWGLLIAMEWPDPENSYLMGLNQVIQTSLWNPSIPYYQAFSELRRMSVNAMTLKSVMELPQGSTKKDNQAQAQTFLPKSAYPNLDTDACDAVLLCQFASWGVSMLQGHFDTVPIKAQASLARDEMKVKVKTNSKTGEVISRTETPAGLLYNPDLWTQIVLPKSIILKRADAVIKKRLLDSFTLAI